MSLRDAYELIRDENRWTQGAMYRDANGEMTYNETAVRFCASGAVTKCGISADECIALNAVAFELFPDLPEIPSELYRGVAPLVWINDILGHDAVMQVFEKALVEVEGSL